MPGRRGFTLVELLAVVLIAGALGTLATPRLSLHMERRAVLQARDAFVAIAARGRSAALQRGEIVVLRALPDTDRIIVYGGNGSDTLEILDLASGRGVDLLAATAPVVCYTPRGFAHPGCGSGSQLPMRVSFTAGGDTLSATITPIGLVEKW